MLGTHLTIHCLSMNCVTNNQQLLTNNHLLLTMKKNAFFIFFILFNGLPLLLLAQENLFSNPSFENFDTCLNSQSKDTNRLTKDWSQPTPNGSISTIPCDDNFWRPYIRAIIEARTGIAVQYFATYYDDKRAFNADFRSYIVTKLKKTLVQDAKYFFRMYIRCIYNNNLSGFCKTNNQAVAFTTKYPVDAPDGQGAINLAPSIQNDKIVDTVWTEISGCFTAKGGEEYAIFGNFKKKDGTLIQKLANNSNPDVLLGSYIIDDVLLVPLNIELPQDTAICAGDTLVLDIKTPFSAAIKWQDGSTTPQYRVSKNGIYTVSLTYTINNMTCTTEQQIRVSILPRYKPLKIVDTTICFEKNILLKVGTGRRDDTITWQDNSRKDTFRVEKTGTYTAQIANACGHYTENYNVNFINCAINIYVPNVFSPNGDNQNEAFRPYIHAEFPIIDYEFAVFNRWGHLVFQSTDQNAAWDGTFKGKALQSDIYVWMLKIKASVGGKIKIKEEAGEVSLLK